MNLIEKLRNHLGYQPFIKVDPNTQQLSHSGEPKQKMGQAVVTSVLTAIYQLSRTEEGFSYLVNKDRNIPWDVLLFGDESDTVTTSISKFSGQGEAVVNRALEEAGRGAWEISSNDLKGKMNPDSFGAYVSSSRNDLLSYLPPQLNLGKKLHDNSLDDRTNKMAGPVSDMMHKIEKIFSKTQGPDRHDNF